MLRFLRKYQLIIMAIGGSLLMVAFLLSSVLQQLPRMGFNSTVGTIRVENSTHKLRQTDLLQARRELKFIASLYGDPSQHPIEALLNPFGVEPGEPGYIELAGDTHWILLKRAADAAGLIGGGSDADIFIDDVAMMIAQQAGQEVAAVRPLAEAQVYQAAANAQIETITEARQALANFMGAQRLIEMYRSAGVASDLRLRHLINSVSRAVNVQLFLLESEAFIDDAPEPSEEEIAAFFEKYRGVAPGEGEYGLGYRQPDRVMFESIHIPFESVLESITASGLDARTWYKQNPDVHPAAADAETPPEYEEIAGDVMSLYRRSQAEEKIKNIVRFVRQELYRSAQSLPIEDGYRTLPDDWDSQRLSFEQLRQEIQDRFGVDVTYNADMGSWMTVDSIPAELGGEIGSAVRPSGSRDIPFVELIRSHREFDDDTAAIEGLQVGVADSDPVRSRGWAPVRRERTYEDVYFYRVLAADPERPAESIDEVREEIVRDMKRVKAFEMLAADSEEWRMRAIDAGGIEPIAEERDILPERRAVTKFSGGNIAQGMGLDYGEIGSAGVVPELTESILDAVEPLDALEPVSELDLAQRIIVAPVKDKLALAMVEITGQSPVSRETFARRLTSGFSVARRPYSLDEVLSWTQTIDEQEQAGLASAFSFDALRDRFALEYEEGMEEALEEEEAAAAADGMGAAESDGESDDNGPDDGAADGGSERVGGAG